MGAALLLVAGAIGYWFTQGRPGIDPAVETTTLPPQTPVGVGGFAELYLATYLSGTATDLALFLPAAPNVEAMTPAARYVTQTATIEISATASDYWGVVVAADVLALDDGGYVPAGIQYYQVGVVNDGGRLVAAGLPSRVAAPPARSVAPRNLQTADGPPSDLQTALAGDFLEALLTGRRDIVRYTTADSGIEAPRPSPYTALLITSLESYADGTLLVTVDAQEHNGAIATLQYVLRVEDNGAGLAVAELLAGPPSIDVEGGEE